MAEYLDFDLEIGEGEGRDYPLAVLRSPAGEVPQAVFHFPFDVLTLERYQDKLKIALLRSAGRRRQVLSPEELAAQEFGKALFEALFPADVRSCFDRSLERALAQGKGLRLRLRIQPPDLAALPWEYLYDSRQAEYLCLSQNTPIVRYLEMPQPPQPLTVSPPLRVLGMIASPTDLPQLDVATEKERLERALEPLQRIGLATLTWLRGQTWRDLQRQMRAGPWHIFHFIGHGGFDPQTDEGLVALANEQGKKRYLRATQLARLLADHLSLRLAVLNACEGAAGSGLDLFSSTASILVRRGLPAVLAMQYAITDRAAIELSRAFYEALADGLPVDTAVVEARKAIAVELEGSLEWGIPVLHLRAPDGVLFRLEKKAQGSRQGAAAVKGKAAQEKPPLKATPAAAPAVKEPSPKTPAKPAEGEKPRLMGRMRELVQRMTNPNLPPAVRLWAGDELDKLGWLPEDLFAFISIPGLGYPFWIGKYPVTNIQYQRFLEAEDYADPLHWRGFPRYDENCKLLGYWGDEAWQWLQSNWGEQKRHLPFYWKDPRFGIDHKGTPVVGVTWYEANAYCKWLLRHWGELAEAGRNPGLKPKQVRLPLETEWVRAAGGAEPPERFPWDAPGKATQERAEILRRANVDESGLGRTTPVSMYPLGASPLGVMDMAGNVWEWGANFYDKDHDWLVLRGGSWDFDEYLARLSYRNYNRSDYLWSNYGFRVVVLPS